MTITWKVTKKAPKTKVGLAFRSVGKLVVVKSVSGRAKQLTDIVPGLRVLEVNGTTVHSAKAACDIIRAAPVGSIEITTGGQHHSAKRTSEEKTGFDIKVDYSKPDCVLITEVDPNGLFPDVPTGFYLWSVNGKRVKDVKHGLKLLKKSSLEIVIAKPEDVGYDLGVLKPTTIKTKPIDGQKPGTSGLRKKTKVFMGKNYLENFVQSTFDAIKAKGTKVSEGTLLIGGDGRYFNKEAIQTIIKMAVANGVKRVWVGENGLMSTPAVSATIRERGPVWQKAFGAFILTASHNPGGPDEDFGIKYNCENGGPAPDGLTNQIHKNTTKISKYYICPNFPTIDLSKCGPTNVKSLDGMSKEVCVEVISSTENHVNLLKSIFDFDSIKSLLAREDFSMVYDAMHGVNGPYAKKVFVEELGLPETVCMNCVPKDDFNGGHADPNLTYAKELVELMGLDRKGVKIDTGDRAVPSFGAAADGDGDRNMILGSGFFVSPSDSLAVIAAYAHVIPFFKSQGGLQGVARSMPTSGAVDLVAKDLGFDLFETPTGWKYFGNLMDSKAIYKGKDYTPFICGEESFGTGSDHVREKDGLWAVLAWLSILAFENAADVTSNNLLSILSFRNSTSSKALVTVEDIVKQHWTKYGRNYYCRWDFEGVEKKGAESMMDKMRQDTETNTGREIGKYKIAQADDFTYVDPVDGSVAKKQGIRFLMEDGSRIIFRLSGTAGSGATVRMYIEQYEKEDIDMVASEALDGLVKVALELSAIKSYIGTDEPTVIT